MSLVISYLFLSECMTKTNPKETQIPCPALHPPWQLDPERGLCLCEVSCTQTAFRSGKGWQLPWQSAFQLSRQSWCVAVPGSTASPEPWQDLPWEPLAAPCPTESQGSLSVFSLSVLEVKHPWRCTLLCFKVPTYNWDHTLKHFLLASAWKNKCGESFGSGLQVCLSLCCLRNWCRDERSSSVGGVQGVHELEHCCDMHSAGSGTFQQVGDLVSGAVVPPAGLQSWVCQHSQGGRATLGKVAGPAGFGQILSPAAAQSHPLSSTQQPKRGGEGSSYAGRS